ncbi:hypothetical protein [Pseudomarimonas arenosa]|uniref:Uncharacterized protein n=1 Tax=Pseudomarimonas arenosa TaxID=2774145 RepID=A0AAW3ZER5_9GAMM|nr:hypothetical protein [Pseudomarimonas arenosa]MBD8524628.1 hypothetical protein [Pseudomarimonas arenosa]
MQASSAMRWLGAIMSAAGFAVIGGQVLRLWLDTSAWGDERWVGYVPRLLITEFVLLGVTLVAASLCSKTRRWSNRALIVAGFLFAFFAPSIYVAGRLGDDPLVDYLLLLIGLRFLLLVTSSAAGLQHLIGQTAVSICILILVILSMLVLTALVPMPLGDIDTALLDRLIPWNASTGWEREPQRAMATVLVYCLAMVCVELLLIGPGVRPLPRRRR